jgi:hypothetical protein
MIIRTDAVRYVLVFFVIRMKLQNIKMQMQSNVVDQIAKQCRR